MARSESAQLSAATFVTAIAALAAVLVTLSYDVSRVRIAENRRMRLEAQLEEVLGNRVHDNDIGASGCVVMAPKLLGSRMPVEIYRATANGAVVAVVLTASSPNGYNGPIGVLVGIDASGRITGVRVSSHRETPGLGDAIEIERSDWITGFDGTSLDSPPVDAWRVAKDGGHFDALTGATVTPRAVTEAVRNALLYFRENRSSLLDACWNGTTNDAQ